jgi:hypothetical protein
LRYRLLIATSILLFFRIITSALQLRRQKIK